MVLRAAIFEDEPALSEALCGLISKWAGGAHTVSFSCFADGTQMTEELAQSCDILFFDIELGRECGLEIAQRAREYNAEVPIVFTTSHCEYAIRGYQAEPFRYLVKPVRESDCVVCMERAVSYHEACQAEALMLNRRGGVRRIPAREILYMEAQEHHCLVVTTREHQRFSMSFSTLLAALPEGGLQQCHRSYIVNCAHISSMGGGVLVLDTGMKIPYTPTFAAQILQKLRRMD